MFKIKWNKSDRIQSFKPIQEKSFFLQCIWNSYANIMLRCILPVIYVKSHVFFKEFDEAEIAI